MKRIAFVLLAACAIVFATSGVAFANFGPHGGYLGDTDACAGCHRAHTSFSTLGWTDLQGAQRTSALLISDAAVMTDFCYACHGNGAPGANTNVQNGIFDGGPTTGMGESAAPASGTFAVSNSSYDATLNGGGFEHIGGSANVMSAHDMTPATQGPLIRWGYMNPTTGVSNLSTMSSFGCADCHDPHGSSNYRLLKDQVNGVTVGGYTGAGNPDPYVLSNEEGFPTGGFKKGAPGQADIANYKPNYTSAQYAKNPGRAMSAWCSACHTAYSQQDSAAGQPYSYASVDATLGAQIFHRHPVDVALSIGTSTNPDNRALLTPLLDDAGLPLEMGVTQLAAGTSHTDPKIWDERGNVSCLTCHRAHGSEASMSGWAVAELVDTGANGVVPKQVAPGDPALLASRSNPLGVDPNFSGAILRFDNRGVCERCHNK